MTAGHDSTPRHRRTAPPCAPRLRCCWAASRWLCTSGSCCRAWWAGEPVHRAQLRRAEAGRRVAGRVRLRVLAGAAVPHRLRESLRHPPGAGPGARASAAAVDAEGTHGDGAVRRRRQFQAAVGSSRPRSPACACRWAGAVRGAVLRAQHLRPRDRRQRGALGGAGARPPATSARPSASASPRRRWPPARSRDMPVRFIVDPDLPAA